MAKNKTKNKKAKKKINTSKLITGVAIIQFIAVIIVSIIAILLNKDYGIFCYIIPSSAGVVSIAVAFYYNKAKMENLSKQRIRYSYLKLLLADKLDSETYMEIESEICNIDDAINAKLNSTLVGAVDEEIVSSTNTII